MAISFWYCLLLWPQAGAVTLGLWAQPLDPKTPSFTTTYTSASDRDAAMFVLRTC